MKTVATTAGSNDDDDDDLFDDSTCDIDMIELMHGQDST